jgi:hypothetical protein
MTDWLIDWRVRWNWAPWYCGLERKGVCVCVCVCERTHKKAVVAYTKVLSLHVRTDWGRPGNISETTAAELEFEPGISTGITQWYSAGYGLDRGFESRQRFGIFLLTTVSRPVLGSTEPPIQRVPGTFPGGKATGGVKLTAHLHPVSRSRMRGTIPLLPQYAFVAWCSVKAQGQLYLLPYWQ